MQAYGKRVFSFDNTDVALRKAAAEGFCGIDSFRVFGGKFFIQGKKSNPFLNIALPYTRRIFLRRG